MKGRIIIIIFACLLLISNTFVIAADINFNQTIEEPKSASSGNDDWPMSRKNPEHTGFSPSELPTRLRTSWKFKTESFVYHSPVITGDYVYQIVEPGGWEDFGLYCLNAKNGKVIWEWGEEKYPDSNVAVHNGKIYFAEGRFIFCLNAEIGDEIWTHNVNPTSSSTYYDDPIIVDDKLYFGLISEDIGKVLCFNTESKNEIWNTELGDDGLPLLAIANGKIFVSQQGGNLYCINSETGNTIWSYDTCCFRLSPTIYNDNVYFGARDDKNGIIYCLDANNGDFKWSHILVTHQYQNVHMGSLTIAYDKVYVGSHGEECDRFHCFDAETGDEIWHHDSQKYSFDESSPVVADGKIYINARNNFLCYDAITGKKKFTFFPFYLAVPLIPLIKGKVWFGEPAIANGKIYVPCSYQKKIFGSTNDYYNFGMLIAFGNRGIFS